MPEQDPTTPPVSQGMDPMALRADDPRIGRWWWSARLYRRQDGRPRFFVGAGRLALMVLLFCAIAGALAWALGRAGG